MPIRIQPASPGCCLVSLLLLPFRIIILPFRILISPSRRNNLPRRW
jgi:hypothetical protein